MTDERGELGGEGGQNCCKIWNAAKEYDNPWAKFLPLPFYRLP
jgi:hypothetical protein